ncbi:hypothetical protein QN277_006392 [Acacia crassicarpa]|uniref:Uncharacterized protein n=1 Tax=Acacia crassicarpa TaxID=499986 RepID=A0AAE1M7S2_9FABA|nr:hypothetical protein QN277_006392 [Acacia crassicarpa]
MIRDVPENPRFGNSQSEEKEYFSGGRVESVKAYPLLNKSNSYNEERSDDKVEEEDGDKKKGVKGKCVHRKK